MAIQNECDMCGESWPVDALVLVEHNNRLMCPECINDLIDDLYHQLDNFKAVHLAIELYNQEKVHNNIVWGD